MLKRAGRLVICKQGNEELQVVQREVTRQGVVGLVLCQASKHVGTVRALFEKNENKTGAVNSQVTSSVQLGQSTLKALVVVVNPPNMGQVQQGGEECHPVQGNMGAHQMAEGDSGERQSKVAKILLAMSRQPLSIKCECVVEEGCCVLVASVFQGNSTPRHPDQKTKPGVRKEYHYNKVHCVNRVCVHVSH